MNYKIAETFYSLKGEGEWTGIAMFFIRLSGCNLNCEFCDTDYEESRESSIQELVALAEEHPARKVVITGGEPCLQDTQPLVVELRKRGFKTHLETNGTLDTHYDWDWIAVSPKGPVEKLSVRTMMLANEIKFLAGKPGWERYIDDVSLRFNMEPRDMPPRIRWVMPIARPYPSRGPEGIIKDNLSQAIEYCLTHPKLKLCTQIHKYVGIP